MIALLLPCFDIIILCTNPNSRVQIINSSADQWVLMGYVHVQNGSIPASCASMPTMPGLYISTSRFQN